MEQNNGGKEWVALSERNMRRAMEVIEATDVVNIWRGIGAEINMVGSLRTGLLCRHRDIDFHIYTEELRVEESFAAVARLAAKRGVKRVAFTNLAETEEECLEWHAWYEGTDGEEWQMDMIQMRRGSAYDGYFERVAEEVRRRLTPETREAILRLKYETPAEEKIMGIVYYKAVIQDGVRSMEGLRRWMAEHETGGIVKW